MSFQNFQTEADISHVVLGQKKFGTDYSVECVFPGNNTSSICSSIFIVLRMSVVISVTTNTPITVKDHALSRRSTIVVLVIGVVWARIGVDWPRKTVVDQEAQVDQLYKQDESVEMQHFVLESDHAGALIGARNVRKLGQPTGPHARTYGHGTTPAANEV
jgi:hypothetical protein